MVVNYVDFHLDDLPKFGSASFCKYRGLDVQCGPRGLRGAGDSRRMVRAVPGSSRVRSRVR